MADTSDKNVLEKIIELEKLTDPPAGGEEFGFRVWNQPKPDGRLFGGQVLAQCVMAASATVDDDRPIHSFHGYFLRAGAVDEETTIGVEDLRDGGSFSARRVQAYQKGMPILSGISSFQKVQPGLEHREPMPQALPHPEALPSLEKILGKLDITRFTRAERMREWLMQRPFDIRPISPDIHAGFLGSPEPINRFWARLKEPFTGIDSRAATAAILAYASDFAMLEPSLRVHGLTWADPRLRIASLDHAIWWHSHVDVTGWLLFDMSSPSSDGGRGLGIGRIYNQQGELAASVAQQGMVRLKES